MQAYYESSIAVKDCLEQQGHPISDPPSLATFKAQYAAVMTNPDSTDFWDPWSEIDAVALGRAGFEELERICPEPGW